MSPVDLCDSVEAEIHKFIDWETWELSQKAEEAETSATPVFTGVALGV